MQDFRVVATVFLGVFKNSSDFYFPVDPLIIDSIEAIYNPQVVQDFRSFQDKVKRRQNENPTLFKSQDWNLADDADRRRTVLEKYNHYAKCMPHPFLRISSPLLFS